MKKRCLSWAILAILLMSSQVLQAQIEIQGTVKNTKGDPLPGVNIVEKGTNNGTTTDMDGQFSFTVSNEKATVVFSFVGMQTIEKKVGDRRDFQIVLKPGSSELDEVVVVGYGTQKKRSLTGSVSDVDADELDESSSHNLSNKLAGRLPGLVSRQTSGAPGSSGASLYVRGMSTTGNNQPTVLVDGVQRDLSNVDPNSIKNVSILKDAASAAVYGVQGANGVILVTTKQGEKGQGPQISFENSVDLTQNTRFPDFLNGPDYAYWHNKARELDGKEPVYSSDAIEKIQQGHDPQGVYGDTDWLDRLFNDFGMNSHHSLSVRGGNDKVQYFVLGGMLNQNGIIDHVDFTRYNLRSNVDVNVTENLTTSLSLAARQEKRDRPYLGVQPNGWLNLVYQAIKAKPTIPAYTNDGEPVGSDLGWGNANPIMARDNSGYYNSTRNIFQSSLNIDYQVPFVKGLSLEFMGSYDRDYTRTKSWKEPYKLMVYKEGSDQYVEQWASHASGGINSLSEGFADSWRRTLRPAIRFDRSFGAHDLEVLALYEQSKQVYDDFSAAKRAFDLGAIQQLEFSDEVVPNSVTGSKAISVRAGYVGRINYSFDDKYLVQLSGRYDGSARFPQDKRWGFFPAASLGWRVSEEPFFNDQFGFVDHLKLRGSAGQMGNDQIGKYQYLRSMQMTNNPAYLIGGSPVQALYTGAVPNYNITWETATTYNAGFDLDMWEGKLGVEFDWFYKVTTDILQNIGGVMPPSLGGNYPSVVNRGIVDNRGIELVLSHRNKIGKDFSYRLRGNLTYSKNRHIKTDDSPNIPDYQKRVGRPLGGRLGFVAEGLFQSEEEIRNSPLLKENVRPGDIKYKDLNGDGKITYEQDRTWIGKSSIPEVVFGFNLNAAYKNFDLSLFLQGAARTDLALSGTYGSGIEDNTQFTRPFKTGGNSPYYLVENSWTPENRDAKFTRLSTEYRSNNAYASTWWIRDASYVRIKNVQLGYELPKRLLNRFNIEKLRVYVSADNLYTFSSLDYLDPESPNVHNGYYPQQRIFSLGVNLSL